MAPRRRPYVPKTKGCYQCGRRRIHCDRNGPQCGKCRSRGLKCTGLGVEIYVDCHVGPVSSVPVPVPAPVPDPGPVSFGVEQYPVQAHGLEPIQIDVWPSQDIVLSSQTVEESSDEELYDVYYRIPSEVGDHVSAWKRHLCLNFSKHIAFEMETVDGIDNRWRTLVLSLADQDDLVMSAVLAVSAFHIHLVNSPRHATSGPAATDPYGGTLEAFPAYLHRLDSNVVASLKNYAQLDTLDTAQKQSILITILVLQVGAMVTGRSDFPSLYRMLDSAFNAVGGMEGLGGGEAPAFIKSQVDKFRFYGATLLDENAGLEVISSPAHARDLLDSLSSRWSDHPEHRETISYVKDLVRQALDMYLDAALSRSEQEAAAAVAWLSPEEAAAAYPSPEEAALRADSARIRVQHFIETLQALLDSPAGASCEQALIWSTFVVGSGCMMREHELFFEGVFLRHYARSGFLNVLEGLKTLRKIWSRQDTSMRWTALLAQTKKLVM